MPESKLRSDLEDMIKGGYSIEASDLAMAVSLRARKKGYREQEIEGLLEQIAAWRKSRKTNK